MKWLYHIKKKMPAALLLFAVLAIVLMNNLRDQKNSEQINKLVTSIYDDRLVVENYILNLSENMHEIIDIIQSGHTEAKKKEALIAVMYEIEDINARYKKTVFTEEEEKYFMQFSGMCHVLKTHILNNEPAACEQVAVSSFKVLNTLSAIQVNEAKSMVSQTDRLFRSYQSSSQLEMAVLIIIALIIQALVFTSNVGKPMVDQRHNLN